MKAKVKKLLMEKCQLHTIIRLPNGVFAPYTGIKTNLLFFTKGKPTDTIWFYEHRYPSGVKSYSKTKPLSVEEFKPIEDWWGNESDGFAGRVQNDVAWRFDFRAIKEAAEAKAFPHWRKAELLNNDAENLADKARSLKESIKSFQGKDRASTAPMERDLEALTLRIEQTKQLAKDEDAIGDRHFWPIYKLDIKNPKAPEEETHDADKLLAKYKALLGEIDKTQSKLKAELSVALARHSGSEEAD